MKTYNSKVFGTDLLFKSQIGVFIKNPKYYAKEFYEKKTDLKKRLELISKYSNNSIVRNLSTEGENFEISKFFPSICVWKQIRIVLQWSVLLNIKRGTKTSAVIVVTRIVAIAIGDRITETIIVVTETIIVVTETIIFEFI